MTFLFHILEINGLQARAIYLDAPQHFMFNNQTSEQKIAFTLNTGAKIDIDLEGIPVKNRQNLVCDTIKLDGVFYNFTKHNPPNLTFCAFNLTK